MAISTVPDQATPEDVVPLSGGTRKIFRRLAGRNEIPVLLIIVVIIVAMSITSPAFLTATNLTTLLIGLSAQGIVVVGMTIVLASGGIDLSVGAVLGLSAVVTAMVFSTGASIWVAVIGGLATGAFVGLVNGLLISQVKIDPLIATLGTLTVGSGAIYVLTNGAQISIISAPAEFLNLGVGRIFGVIPIIVVLFVIVAVIADILMRRAAALRRVIYVGSNQKAARLSGISVTRVQIAVYITASLLAAFAGILSLARFGVATPQMGVGIELQVIAAAVIGGAAIGGGSGSIFGSVLGVVLLSLINNSLVLLGVSVNWQNVVFGGILLLAVSIDQLSRRRRTTRPASHRPEPVGAAKTSR
ncbi:ABC transporter permease [Herbiconiux ginsengi]|uniref:Monosaccharide ABC transporter membrane protein, CUT2 family n=1 Tax=Herbiconiux ginsengi TaxID=381665 RepID=A0A1H3U0K9_9MICO|nr:ABC transporter permease [Herbiconiux ginsengi]SDZ55601.1 monosaccharide ABC transporter membrane protein, CUT2 family [Herbiconiux ginsengi]